jgi:hypothetical protein
MPFSHTDLKQGMKANISVVRTYLYSRGFKNNGAQTEPKAVSLVHRIYSDITIEFETVGNSVREKDFHVIRRACHDLEARINDLPKNGAPKELTLPAEFRHEFKAFQTGTHVALQYSGFPELNIRFQSPNGVAEKILQQQICALEQTYHVIIPALRTLRDDYDFVITPDTDDVRFSHGDLGLSETYRRDDKKCLQNLQDLLTRLEKTTKEREENRYLILVALENKGFQITDNPDSKTLIITHPDAPDMTIPPIPYRGACLIDRTALATIAQLDALTIEKKSELVAAIDEASPEPPVAAMPDPQIAVPLNAADEGETDGTTPKKDSGDNGEVSFVPVAAMAAPSNVSVTETPLPEEPVPSATTAEFIQKTTAQQATTQNDYTNSFGWWTAKLVGERGWTLDQFAEHLKAELEEQKSQVITGKTVEAWEDNNGVPASAAELQATIKLLRGCSS